MKRLTCTKGPVRMAVIGCGAVSIAHHIPAILSCRGAELCALTDRDAKAIDFAINKFKLDYRIARQSGDWDVDAAVVAVPPKNHADVVIGLLREGIHVLCEKPMAATLEQAREMALAARDSSAKLFIGFQKRFGVNTQLMKEALEAEVLGPISNFSLVDGFRLNWDARNVDFFEATTLGGGVLADTGVHWLDRLRYLFGKGQMLSYRDDRIDGIETTCEGRCMFHSPNRDIVVGDFSLSWTEEFGSGLVVRCRDGLLVLSDRNPYSISVSIEHKGQYYHLHRNADQKARWMSNYDRQIDAFCRLVIGEDSNCEIATAHDGVEAMALVTSAYEMRRSLSLSWVTSGIVERQGTLLE